MAERVAVEVSMETCLRQFATVANSRNSKGNAKVAICKPFPVAYSREDRNLHLFASPSNSRPMRAAQPRRVTCAEHHGRSTRSEWPHNRKRNHPRPPLLETTRVDGVKAPQHRGTPRSYRLDLEVVDLPIKAADDGADVRVGRRDARVQAPRSQVPSRQV